MPEEQLEVHPERLESDHFDEFECTKEEQRQEWARSSDMQQSIAAFQRMINKPLPIRPTAPPMSELWTYLNILLEETGELIEAAGWETRNEDRLEPQALLDMKHDILLRKAGSVNLVKLADGCADVISIVIGILNLAGIGDYHLMREVTHNNCLKVGKTTIDPRTGKHVKPKDHPRPRIREILLKQGWEPPVGLPAS